MNKIIYYFLIVSLFPLSALSRVGGHDGGGGQGLVCYNDRGEIESVELLDFYEGSILDNLEIPEYEGEAIDIAKSRFQYFYPEWYASLFEYIYKSFHYLPTGVRLREIDDGNVIYVSPKCQIEQVANFQGLNRVFVVKDFWEKMSPTHQAGLMMHEFLWYQERTQGVAHSARVKRNVARIFSSNLQFEVQPALSFIPQMSCWNNEAPYTYFRIKKKLEFHFDQLAGELNFTQYDVSVEDKQMLASVLLNPQAPYIEIGDGWTNEVTSKTFELLLHSSDGKLIAVLKIRWDSNEKENLFMDLHHYEYENFSQKDIAFQCFG